MSYKKALKRLENLPPGERQLACGRFVNSIVRGKPHCGCSVGKVLSQKDRLKLIREERKIEASSSDRMLIANQGGSFGLAKVLGIKIPEGDKPFLCGMTFGETEDVISKNDSVLPDRQSKKAMVLRYKRMINWLRKQVREEELDGTL